MIRDVGAVYLLSEVVATPNLINFLLFNRKFTTNLQKIKKKNFLPGDFVVNCRDVTGKLHVR